MLLQTLDSYEIKEVFKSLHCTIKILVAHFCMSYPNLYVDYGTFSTFHLRMYILLYRKGKINDVDVYG